MIQAINKINIEGPENSQATASPSASESISEYSIPALISYIRVFAYLDVVQSSTIISGQGLSLP